LIILSHFYHSIHTSCFCCFCCKALLLTAHQHIIMCR